jgi:hypothetical protein
MTMNRTFKCIKLLMTCLSISMLFCVQIASGQTAASEAETFNTSNYERIIGQAINDIFPEPPGVFDRQKYEIQKAKTINKLEGEANEELVTSLMALGATYTPGSANDIAEIVSRANTFLTNENGAILSGLILSTGLDDLQTELEGFSNIDVSIQIETLTKHLESIKIIKQAILVKLNRYQTYTINEQSSPLITSENNSYNLCDAGTPPTQNGLSTIVGFLNTTHTNNTNIINNLTNTINTDFGIYPLPISTTVAEIDVLIADPLTTPIQVNSLETIKSNMETKAQLIQDNIDITACNTQISPKVAETAVIKTDEDNYLIGVVNSIIDTGASTPLPPLPTNYTSFDISNVCLTLPPSVSTEVNAVKSNCTSWINYYKTPYTIANVNTDPVTAVGEARYLAISNCGKAGRTCTPAPMIRLGNELKALGVFPIGRLIVAEMILQSLAKAVLFYNNLLYSPQLFDCELLTNVNTLTEVIARRDCHKIQKESLVCSVGIGIDCDRAEIGFQLNKLKIDSIDETLAETTENGVSNQTGEELGQGGSGTGELAFQGGKKSNENISGDSSPITFVPLNDNSGTSGNLNLNKNAGTTDGFDKKGNTVDFAQNTAFNNLTLTKLGAQLTGRGSFRIINRFMKNKFKIKKKLKENFKSKSTDGIANEISKGFSNVSIEKIANSFGGQDNLFASAGFTNGVKEKDARGSKTAEAATTSYRPNNYQSNYRFNPRSSNIRRKKKSTEEGPTLIDDIIEIEAYPGAANYRPKKYFAKIHTKNIGLFEIISRRFRRTDIYFNNTY